MNRSKNLNFSMSPVGEKSKAKPFFLTIVAVLVYVSITWAQEAWLSFAKGNFNTTPSSTLSYNKVTIEKNGINTQFKMDIDFPGAFVSYPDDFGLLAGRYAVLSFPGKGTELMYYFINGTFQPEKRGLPNLPFVRFHVQVPSSVNEAQISVEAIPAQFVQIEGTYSVAPIQEDLPESFTPGIDPDNRSFTQNKEIYSRDENFTHPLEYELKNMHGMKFVEIRCCPVQYNPVQKKLLAATNVQVVVTYPASAVDESKGNIFESIVRNSTFDGITGQLRQDQSESYLDDNQQKGKVVIVSAQKLMSTKTFEEWVTYRKNQGYEIVEKIDAAAVTDVKSKLKTLYGASKFDYVVVVGDETVVPKIFQCAKAAP